MIPKERLDEIKEAAEELILPEPATEEEYPDSLFEEGFEEYKAHLKRKRTFSSTSFRRLTDWAYYQRWIHIPLRTISAPETFSPDEQKVFLGFIDSRLRHRYWMAFK